ncbi:uncharacterized protein TNCV_1601361 [Trichonephila clavipes]|nr:uncharacterized protein TNCV_1601361 [Trichonephila clavipes]
MREDACVRTCQPDYIWSEKLKDLSIADVGSITRIATVMDNVSEHVDITELEVKLKKIDQLQRKIEELKELLFGLETAKPNRRSGIRRRFIQMLNRVAISSDIRQAFLQICLADKHKDFVRFLWTDSNPRIGEKLTLQVYRFNRVIFGVNSSPFLLAATIKYHIEKYNEIHPITVQHLDSFMYVDDWITGQDTREEALFMSRHAKNIMKEAGMEMRKWISNDTVLMAQWAAEGFDTHPMDASIRLGTNKTKVLVMAWQTLDDCLTLDTKDNLRIPRLVLDSTNDEVSDLIEIHIFCDASKLAYGAAAYVKLLGALVAARLSSRVQEIVRKKKECKVFHWTDSKIVLFWIKGSSKRWKQFVANRVQEISELTDPDSWFHCSDKTIPQISCLGDLVLIHLFPTTNGGLVQPS